VRGVWDHSDGRRAQAVVPKRPADLPEMFRLALEDWQLNPIVAGALEIGENGEMLLGDIRRPEQHVETQQHSGTSPEDIREDVPGGLVFLPATARAFAAVGDRTDGELYFPCRRRALGRTSKFRTQRLAPKAAVGTPQRERLHSESDCKRFSCPCCQAWTLEVNNGPTKIFRPSTATTSAADCES
jgi:hypothetical protein